MQHAQAQAQQHIWGRVSASSTMTAMDFPTYFCQAELEDFLRSCEIWEQDTTRMSLALRDSTLKREVSAVRPATTTTMECQISPSATLAMSRSITTITANFAM